MFPSCRKREAERRQALGCIGTLGRASQAGPQSEIARSCVPAQVGFHRVCAPGDARLSALHRGGLLAPEPAWAWLSDGAHERCPTCLTRLHSQVPLVVAGGRCRSVASRASVCMHQLAGRRIPSHSSRPASAMPRESTLGGRDAVTVTWIGKQSTKDRVLVISLCIAHDAGARSAGTSSNAVPKNLMLLGIAKRRQRQKPRCDQRGLLFDVSMSVERDQFTRRRMSCMRMRTASSVSSFEPHGSL
jgi:hypothetical protein